MFSTLYFFCIQLYIFNPTPPSPLIQAYTFPQPYTSPNSTLYPTPPLNSIPPLNPHPTHPHPLSRVGECKCANHYTMAFCTTDLRKPPAIVPATHIVLNTRMSHDLQVHLSVENVSPDVECLYQQIKVIRGWPGVSSKGCRIQGLVEWRG